MNVFLHEGLEHVAISGLHSVDISACNLQRVIKFYSRVFGFRVVDDARERHLARVLMETRRGVHLSIRERHGAAAPATATPRRWSFVVADLDRVRETLWNLGVVPEGSIEAQRASSWLRSRSLLIRDPDGNEIELVERFPLDDELATSARCTSGQWRKKSAAASMPACQAVHRAPNDERSAAMPCGRRS